ncbi:MAG: cbb3-type cytochrome oxidase assembly protein CcoS [Rhizobiaceae bacterium]
MNMLVWLVPVALVMGLVGLVAFLWSMKSGQLEDLDGAAERVLMDGEGDTPLPDPELSATVVSKREGGSR